MGFNPPPPPISSREKIEPSANGPTATGSSSSSGCLKGFLNAVGLGVVCAASCAFGYLGVTAWKPESRVVVAEVRGSAEPPPRGETAPKAVVRGPSEAKVGKLIELSAEGSEGDSIDWEGDPDLDYKVYGRSLVFAADQAGLYRFRLTASGTVPSEADPTKLLGVSRFAKHVVKVAGPEPVPIPVPTPPLPSPVPVPIPPAPTPGPGPAPIPEPTDPLAAASRSFGRATLAGFAESLRATAKRIEEKNKDLPGMREALSAVGTGWSDRRAAEFDRLLLPLLAKESPGAKFDDSNRQRVASLLRRIAEGVER